MNDKVINQFNSLAYLNSSIDNINEFHMVTG